MKLRMMIPAVILSCLVLRSFAGHLNVFATEAAPAPRRPPHRSGPTTIGGGVERPWTPLYVLAARLRRLSRRRLPW